MENDFTNEDWKLFKEKIKDWQDVYMGKLIKEYIDILNSDTTASERFWELDERIKEDKKKKGVILEMKRSALIFNITSLIDEGVIGLSDLDGFSDKLKDTVEFITERAGRG